MVKFQKDTNSFASEYSILFFCSFLDPDCVAKVKQLYVELRLPELYHDYKKRNQNTVMQLIDQFFYDDENLRNACVSLFSQGYD